MSYGEYGKMNPEYIKHLQKQGTRDAVTGIGALGLNVAGTAMQGFGAYQAYQQAEAQRDEEQRRYEEQVRISEQERKQRDAQNRQNQIAGFGQYAQGMDDRRRGQFGGYAARVGL